MKLTDRIFVAGHRGLVGSAIVRALGNRGFQHIVTKTRSELELTDPVAVRWFFSTHAIDYVFMCAAKVGGVAANAASPLEFFEENMRIQLNVIGEAARYKVQKLLFLASSCIYPASAPQPIPEDSMLTGKIEPSVEPYALAKILGIRLCQWHRRTSGANFISAVPCNLWGPNDNYDPQTGHCIAGLLARLHTAREIKSPKFFVWGDGTARREFLHSEDLARACLLLMERYESPEPVNVGSGLELDMKNLSRTLARIVGYEGELCFDPLKPAGAARKLLISDKLRGLGWSPQEDFDLAVSAAYDDFLSRRSK